MGRIAEGIRLPLTPLASAHHETVAAALKGAGCIN
jgi:4-hydroxy-tetrahydrodipicolinate synthase